MSPVIPTHRPWYRRLVERVRAYWHQRRTLQTLRGLDSHTLADIGIDVSELSSIQAESFGHGVITRRRIVRSLHHG